MDASTFRSSSKRRMCGWRRWNRSDNDSRESEVESHETPALTISPHLTTALADRYRIERELGQGGMATVYLARDLRHDRNVAREVLRPELSPRSIRTSTPSSIPARPTPSCST